MRRMLVLLAMAAFVAAPLPASADENALGIDLDAATIPDLQHRMDQGRLTSVRLTTTYLRRIADIDRKVHSVVAVNRRR
jgi:amidase